MMHHITRAGLLIKNRWSGSLKSYNGLCSLVEHNPTRWEFDLGRGFSTKDTQRTALTDFEERVCDNHLSSFVSPFFLFPYVISNYLFLLLLINIL